MIQFGGLVYCFVLLDLVVLLCSEFNGMCVCFFMVGLVLEEDLFVILLQVFGDEWCLQQVLVNLLENVLCYIYVGGCVCVQVVCVFVGVQLIVEDIVLGVLVDKCVLLFECFYWVESLCNWVSGGSGLGLVISYNIIFVYYGFIYVELLLLGGLCVVIILLEFV